jgi:hypothetical protein
MRLLRSPLPEQPRPLRWLLPIRGNVSKSNKNIEKETLTASNFIGNSSPIGNKAGMRENVRQSNTEASLLAENPSKGIAWG